ncbi:MAG: DUF2142 domain-containing protein [Actinomycetes bacterium]
MDGADPLTVAPASSRPAAGPRGGRRTTGAVRSTLVPAVLVPALLVAAVLTCWAAATGRYGGPDEPAHVVRAHAVAHGDLLGDPVPGLPPGYRAVTVPASLGTGDPACYRHDPTVPSDCAAAQGSGSGSGSVTVATAAGTNPPLAYALVGLPVRLVGAGNDPFAYRLVSVGLLALALALVVRRARWSVPTAALAAAVVTPSAWFLWGVVNPNALEVALVALAAAGVTTARGRPGVADVWWTAVPLALAVAMRPVAALWALALVVVCEIEWRGGLTRATRAVLWGVPAVGAATVLAWSRWSSLVVQDDRTARTGSRLDALRDSIGGLPRSGAELVASLGWLEYRAPWVAIVAWVMAVGLVVRTRPTVRPASWWVLGVALVVVPVVFEVALHDRIGLIWQGRYGLPVAAAAAVLALGSGTRPAGSRACVVASATAATVLVATHWTVARRAAVGTHGSWFFEGAVDSSRLLGPGTWVLVHAALIVTCAAGCGWWCRRQAGDQTTSPVRPRSRTRR